MPVIDNTIALQYKPTDTTGGFDPVKAMSAISTAQMNSAHSRLFDAETDKSRALLPGEITQQGLTALQTRAQTAHTNAVTNLTSIQAQKSQKEQQDTADFAAGKLPPEQYLMLHPQLGGEYLGAAKSHLELGIAKDTQDALRRGDRDTLYRLNPKLGEQVEELDKTRRVNERTVQGYQALDRYRADPSEANFNSLLPEHVKLLSEAEKQRADAMKARAEAAQAGAFAPSVTQPWSPLAQAAPASPAATAPAGTPAGGSQPQPPTEPGTHPEALAGMDPGFAEIVKDIAAGKKPLTSIQEGKQRLAAEAAAKRYKPDAAIDYGVGSYTHTPGVGPGEDGKQVPGTYTFDNRRPVGSGNPVFQPSVVQTLKAPAAGSTLSAETLDRISDQVVKYGDYSGTVGLSRNAANVAAVQDAITGKMKALGKSPGDVTMAKVELTSLTRAEAAVGNRTAQLELAAQSAKVLIPQALQTSEKVDRTKYPDLNTIILAAKSKTGDENVVRFGVAVQGLVNTYAGVVTRGSVTTDTAREKGEKLLQQAWSKGQFSAAVDQMGKEIEAEMGAPGLVKQHLREVFGTSVPKGADAIPHINSKDDYDLLAPGTKFVWKGREGTK